MTDGESWDRSFSWSKLNTYNTCPRQFKFKYIDELDEGVESEARSDGSNFHEYMEKYYQEADPDDGPTKRVAINVAKDLFSKELQAKYRPWIKRWHAYNEHLHETWGSKHWVPTDTELWVEVEVPDSCDIEGLVSGEVHHGYIDRLQWHPEKKSYGVIDYKSKAKNGSRIKGQTAYYSEVLLEIEEILDEPVEWAGCYGYKTGKFRTWDIHWRSTRATKRKIADLRNVEDGFEPEYGYHCEWCPYMEECTELDAKQEGLLSL